MKKHAKTLSYILFAAILSVCALSFYGCGEEEPEETPIGEIELTDASETAEETASDSTEIPSSSPLGSESSPEETDEQTAVPVETEEPETDSPETDPPATKEPDIKVDPDDKVPPFFLNWEDSITVRRGNKFDLHEYFSYLDDVDSDVELTVEGSVDTSVTGSYPLKLTIRDDGGNTASYNTVVKIVEPSSGGGTTTPYTPAVPKSFAEFTERYKKDGAMVGIDVSRWQEYVDFNKVAAAGCEFVIIRMGGYTEYDDTFSDRYFASNIRNAKAAGLKVGVYWYSEENGPAKVRQNAEFLYGLLNGEELDFPIFFDWEDYRHFENYKMSLRDLNEMFLAFRDEAEKHGYKAALYNSRYYLSLLWSDEVKGDGVWLAHYVDETTYTGKYFLWQQGFARIDGVSGDVDVDVFYPSRMP